MHTWSEKWPSGPGKRLDQLPRGESSSRPDRFEGLEAGIRSPQFVARRGRHASSVRSADDERGSFFAVLEPVQGRVDVVSHVLLALHFGVRLTGSGQRSGQLLLQLFESLFL